MASTAVCPSCCAGSPRPSPTSSACRNKRRRRSNFRKTQSGTPAMARSGTGRKAGMASLFSRAARTLSRPAAACRLEILAMPTAATSRRPSMAYSCRASISPMAIRRPVQSSTTSSAGSSVWRRTSQSCWRVEPRSCSQATTTSCRPNSTSTNPHAGLTTPYFGRRFGPPSIAFSHKAGPTRCAELHPGRAHLHLLGLFPERLGPKRGASPRSLASQPVARRPPRRRGR